MGTAPYAGIHEFGGVINHPGGTAYIFIGGRMVFVKKERATSSAVHLPLTRPHTIKIPARPYIRPTAADPGVRSKVSEKFVSNTRAALAGKGWFK